MAEIIPFYTDELITLYNCDCMDFMATCRDKEFELAIVDVPYGIKESSKVLSRPEWCKQKNGNLLFVPHKYKIKNWDNEKPSPEYFKDLFRITENQIIWGANHLGNMPPSPSWIVWDKLNGDSDFADCELAYTSFDTAVRKITYMWSGFCQGESIGSLRQQGNKALNEKRINPCQKPIVLYRWLLQNYAKPGWTIFDSHAGSCSLAIACHDLGFKLVACELDIDYLTAAVTRIKNYLKEPKWFKPVTHSEQMSII